MIPFRAMFHSSASAQVHRVLCAFRGVRGKLVQNIQLFNCGECHVIDDISATPLCSRFNIYSMNLDFEIGKMR